MPIDRDKLKRKCKGIENEMLLMRVWLADNEPETIERMQVFLSAIKTKVTELEDVVVEGVSQPGV